KQLPNDAEAAGPERAPDGQLLFPGGEARQNQIGGVRAGYDQHQGGEGHQNGNEAARVGAPFWNQADTWQDGDSRTVSILQFFNVGREDAGLGASLVEGRFALQAAGNRQSVETIGRRKQESRLPLHGQGNPNLGSRAKIGSTEALRQ